MRRITPWLDLWIYYRSCSYDELPGWLWHPCRCADGILDAQVSEEAVKEILYVLCSNGKAPIGPDAKETLRGL